MKASFCIVLLFAACAFAAQWAQVSIREDCESIVSLYLVEKENGCYPDDISLVWESNESVQCHDEYVEYLDYDIADTQCAGQTDEGRNITRNECSDQGNVVANADCGDSYDLTLLGTGGQTYIVETDYESDTCADGTEFRHTGTLAPTGTLCENTDQSYYVYTKCEANSTVTLGYGCNSDCSQCELAINVPVGVAGCFPSGNTPAAVYGYSFSFQCIVSENSASTFVMSVIVILAAIFIAF